MRRTRLLVALAPASAMLALAFVGWATADPGAATRPAPVAAGQLLPDLDLTAPTGIVVQTAGDGGSKRFRVGFVSAAANIGEGPLVVQGHRSGLAASQMTAAQVILLADGSTMLNAGIGVFEYVEAETHEHWHLLRFMTYELRRAADFSLVRPDGKTGFCLGDRYNADPATRIPGEPIERVYNTNCGPEQRELLQLEEGISVGWGDVYEAWRDAQYLDVTGLLAGTYVLVHRVNPGRLLRESRYANNASSAIIALSWPRGTSRKPKVRVLASCPQTARCKAPSSA